MNRPDKADVRRSFERAALTYDSEAGIQRQICLRLAEHLGGQLPDGHSPKRMVDAGCGTGYAQGLLQSRFPTAQSLALDLSPAMLQQIAVPCSRVAGDLERLPLADGSLDLYWSSLAVQWCDLSAVLEEARRVLSPQGHLALASLGPDTFHELRRAFAGVDDHRHTLSFLGAADVRERAVRVGFSRVTCGQGRLVAHYANFRQLLRAVKAVGANQVGSGRRTGLMSRAAFDRVEQAFEVQRQPAGLPLTYDVIYLHATSG